MFCFVLFCFSPTFFWKLIQNQKTNHLLIFLYESEKFWGEGFVKCWFLSRKQCLSHGGTTRTRSRLCSSFSFRQLRCFVSYNLETQSSKFHFFFLWKIQTMLFTVVLDLSLKLYSKFQDLFECECEIWGF